MSEGDGLRADFARLVRALRQEVGEDDGSRPISEPIQAHLGGTGHDLEVFGDELRPRSSSSRTSTSSRRSERSAPAGRAPCSSS